MTFYSESIENVIRELSSNLETGLDTIEAAIRLVEDGENRITPKGKNTSLQRLRSLLKSRKSLHESFSVSETKVFRDGFKLVVETSQIVPGDIILLEAGDVIPADARLLHSDGLSCEESSLTGRKTLSFKDASVILSVDMPIKDRCNMVFSGCQVLSGSATAVVTATGRNTEMAKNSVSGSD